MSYPTLQHDRQGVDYGDELDVQSLHAAIGHEKRGGRVTIKPFSLWVLVLFGLAFFLAGFWSARTGAHFTATSMESGSPPPSQSTPQTVQADAGVGSLVHDTVTDAKSPPVVYVVIRNMKFNPPKVEVKRGDVVEWRNEDMTAHTATSAAFFDSGSIDSDKSWRHTFTEPGDFPYSCTFHPEMKAVVTVK